MKFLTMLLCSRKKDNPDSNIVKFLSSVMENFTDQERDQIEILIKLDTDDTDSYREVLNRNWWHEEKKLPGKYSQPNLIKTFPLNIKYFIYNRGEGRRSLHNDYKFLFSQKSPESKYVVFVTDDCLFTRPGLISELKRIKSEWALMGDKEPNVKAYPNWRENQDWRKDVSMFPIVSSKIFECVQNMGWQVNIDNWITLLHCILYHQYGLDFWISTPNTYITREGGNSEESQYEKRYNPMEVDNKFKVENSYYFYLVEQQAKNLWLNFNEEKLLELASIIDETYMPWVNHAKRERHRSVEDCNE